MGRETGKWADAQSGKRPLSENGKNRAEWWKREMCAAAIVPPAALLAAAPCTGTGEGAAQSGRGAGARPYSHAAAPRMGIGQWALGVAVACLSKVTAPWGGGNTCRKEARRKKWKNEKDKKQKKAKQKKENSTAGSCRPGAQLPQLPFHASAFAFISCWLFVPESQCCGGDIAAKQCRKGSVVWTRVRSRQRAEPDRASRRGRRRSRSLPLYPLPPTPGGSERAPDQVRQSMHRELLHPDQTLPGSASAPRAHRSAAEERRAAR